MPLRTRNRSGRPVDTAALRRLCARALGAWEVDPAAEATLLLTGDEELRRLNREFRGLDQPTDVLSFPAGPPLPGDPPGPPALGDLAISVETAARQAAELGHSVEEELRVLVIHGLLHLLGHDHELDHDHRRMEEAARLVLGGPR